MSEHDYEAYLQLLSRFLGLSAAQRDSIRRELRAHLEEAIEAEVAAGASREQAISRALDDFGDAAELAARFRSIGARKRWFMRGTAVAALVGFVSISTYFFAPTHREQVVAAPAGEASPGARAATDVQADDARMEAALDAVVPTVAFESAPLAEVLNYIGETLKINVCVLWNDVEAAGVGRDVPISLSLKQVPWRRVLELALELADPDARLTPEVRDGVLYVATLERCRRVQTIEVYDVRDLLATTAPVRVRATAGPHRAPAAIVAPTAPAAPGEPSRAVAQPATPVPPAPPQPSGDPRMLGATVSSAPDDQTSAPAAPFAVDPRPAHAPRAATLLEALRATTPAAASPEDELVDLIQSMVEPETWQENGGAGSLRLFAGNLVVRQSPDIQRVIGKLLRDLRENLAAADASDPAEAGAAGGAK